ILETLAAAGLTGGAYQRALLAILWQLEPFALVEKVVPGATILRFPVEGRATVLVHGAGPLDAVTLGQLIKPHVPMGLDVCVVSDAADQDAMLKKSLPSFTGAGVPLYRFSSMGELTTI